jgi:hypothetical protein
MGSVEVILGFLGLIFINKYIVAIRIALKNLVFGLPSSFIKSSNKELVFSFD